MKKSVCLSQDSNLGSQIYLYGLIQPIRGRNRVNVGPGDPFGRVHYVHHSESSSSSNKLTDPLIVWTWPVFTCLHNFPTNTLHPFSLHINASTQSRHHRFSSIHLETKSQRVEFILKIFEIFVRNRIIRLKYLTETFTFSLYFR